MTEKDKNDTISRKEEMENIESVQAEGNGVVDGLGGAGGSSGTGSVSAKAHTSGAVSGIDNAGNLNDTSDTDNLPNTGADAGAASGDHRNMLDEHGIPGKTRGSVSETMPAKTNPAKKR